MNANFTDVKVLVWDFDGTLYPPNPKLWHDVREAEYRVIKNHTGWPRTKIVDEFDRLHKKVAKSATKVTSILSHIAPQEAAIEMERYFDRRKYLKRDEKLIALFKKLKSYRHCILANGVIANHKKTLRLLGVPPSTFELFVTSETVGETKPSLAGFLYVLNYTKLPARQHLMIGDRESSDILPAHELGMKTCLVWSSSQDSVADVTLPDVYALASELI